MSPTKVSTSSLVSTQIPAEYKTSSMGDVISLLEKQQEQYKPLTKEQLEKIRRRQKAQGIMSGITDAVRSVANLISTHNYAPSMYDSNKSMYAKAKEQADKENADIEAKNEKFYQLAMDIAKLKDADKAKGLEIWLKEQELARKDRDYNDGRKDRDDDVAFRNKQHDDEVAFRDKQFDREGEWHKEEGERWNKEFAKNERQFNVREARASRSGSGSSGGGKGGSKGKSKRQAAHDYWASLTPGQKQLYRRHNNRIASRKYNAETGKYDTTYMADDEDFIQMVYDEHVGFMNNAENVTMPGVSGNTMPGVK